MSTTVGREAESVAADYLQRRGFEVLARNWRTRWCEIDIVARLGDVIYFVEVKYRGRADWGTGVDYITPRKLRQIHFAANFWMARYAHATDYCLAAVGLTAAPPRVIDWVAPIL